MPDESVGTVEVSLDPKEQIHQILCVVSQVLEVEVKLVPNGEDGGKLEPQYDVNACISKFLALLVYVGLTVPGNPAPPYNRVHADIQFWKDHFEKKAV